MPASIPPITMHEPMLKPNAKPWKKWPPPQGLVSLRNGSATPTCWPGSILSNEPWIMRRCGWSRLRKQTGSTSVPRIIRSFRLPLKVLGDKFSHTRFEPSGWSTNPQIGYAKSLMDYIFRWLALKFLPPTSPPPTGAEAMAMAPAPAHPEADPPGEVQTDAPTCKDCGAIMTRNGSCYHSANCGSTSGCS
jgi:hypothetical protein